MKRVLIAIIAFSFFCPINVNSVAQEGDQIPIVVKKPKDLGDRPRSGGFLPISAILLSESIVVFFSGNCGNVDVVLESSSSGVLGTETLDGSLIFDTIPFNYGPGHYTITFFLSSGYVYEGLFDI